MKPENVVPKEIIEKFAETDSFFVPGKLISYLAQVAGFETYAEVGVWKGHNTRFFVEKLQEAGKEFSYFAVDLWDRIPKTSAVWQKYSEQIPFIRHIYNYNLIKSDTRKDVFDMIIDSDEAALKFKPASVDCCLIDTLFCQNSPIANVEAWWPKIRKNGVMLAYNIQKEEDRKLIEDFVASKDLVVKFECEADVWFALIEKV